MLAPEAKGCLVSGLSGPEASAPKRGSLGFHAYWGRSSNGLERERLLIPLPFKRTTEASRGFPWRAFGLFFSWFLPFSWQVAC